MVDSVEGGISMDRNIEYDVPAIEESCPNTAISN